MSGILGLGPSPSLCLSGGATAAMIGPKLPRIIDQKMAGFSRDAQRMYWPGAWKNWTGAIVTVCEVSCVIEEWSN